MTQFSLRIQDNLKKYIAIKKSESSMAAAHCLKNNTLFENGRQQHLFEKVKTTSYFWKKKTEK